MKLSVIFIIFLTNGAIDARAQNPSDLPTAVITTTAPPTTISDPVQTFLTILKTSAIMIGLQTDATDFLVTGQDPYFDADTDVYVLMYTSGNNQVGQNIKASNDSILNSNFDPSKPVRVVIHGYVDDHSGDMATEITAAFLAFGDYNVLVVDWGFGALDLNYLNARLRCEAVATVVANLLNFLIANEYTIPNNVTIIGLSLGAHIAGMTGKKIIGEKVAAVIALDPALPFFNPANPLDRVAKGDAKYVEVIHTDAGILGMGNPIGDADFYVNGGSKQYGCGNSDACSHNRAAQYYAESIGISQFYASQCKSYADVLLKQCTIQLSGAVMGGDPASYQSGVFMVYTNMQPPFAKGPKITSVTFNDEQQIAVVMALQSSYVTLVNSQGNANESEIMQVSSIL